MIMMMMTVTMTTMMMDDNDNNNNKIENIEKKERKIIRKILGPRFTDDQYRLRSNTPTFTVIYENAD